MTDARSIAVELLDQVRSGDQTLDHLLRKADHRLQSLGRSDRALLHALVFGVLRWQSRLDRVIAQLSNRPEKKIDPLVNIILRLGLFQIQNLDRIPDSAAVNTSVELAKKFRRKWAAGFINGTLRRAAARPMEHVWPDRRQDPAAYLSAYHAFPPWLISRWLSRWGEEETERLCEAVNTVPDITLRTNTLRCSREDLLGHLQEEAKTVKPSLHCPEGICLSSLHRPIAQWPAFQQGWFQVQNEAAQCVGHLVSPQPGQTVWDACAGLGTKTAHLAQLMENRGRILATDLSENKLGRLRLEMARLGIGIVDTRPADLLQPEMFRFTEKFDRILLDAPCSGMGVLQRNPDGKWRHDAAAIQIHHRRQATLLENASAHLKPDGLLVYAVCSFEPEENEEVIRGFLQKHPDFGIDHPRLGRVDHRGELLTSEGFLKTLPHRHHMDGFFAAALKKRR
jgi:16S rRNA (cytosine967-C5)-methyltransferase